MMRSQRDHVKDVAQIVVLVLAQNELGGNAHVVISDENVEDVFILGCLDGIAENVWESSQEEQAVERECLRSLLALSEADRLAAITAAKAMIRQ